MVMNVVTSHLRRFCMSLMKFVIRSSSVLYFTAMGLIESMTTRSMFAMKIRSSNALFVSTSCSVSLSG